MLFDPEPGRASTCFALRFFRADLDIGRLDFDEDRAQIQDVVSHTCGSSSCRFEDIEDMMQSPRVCLGTHRADGDDG